MKYKQTHLSERGNIGDIFVGKHQLFDNRTADVAGVCVDNSGNLYISDPVRNIIIKVRPNGEVIEWAGKNNQSGNNKNEKVKGKDALFNGPLGITVDASGNVYVADTGNNQIRKITPDQYVTLFAGNPDGEAGFKREIGSKALFNQPTDVACNVSGDVYVADRLNHAIRKIQSGTSKVVTVAGTGEAGDSYGAGTSSQLNHPYSACCDAAGNLFIMDAGNYKIKLLNKSFNLLKFSGSGVKGTDLGDQSTCQYNDLRFCDVDRSGNIYVVDYREDSNSRLVRINTNGIPGNVKDFAVAAENGYVLAVTVNKSGVLFVTESEYAEAYYSSTSSESSSSSSSSSSIDSSSSSSSSSSFDDFVKITEDGSRRITEDGIPMLHE